VVNPVALATHAQVPGRAPADPLAITTPMVGREMPVAKPGGGNTTAGGSAAPLGKAGVYNPGEAVEVWSASLQTWCPGVVERTEAGMALVAFRSPVDGQPLTKGVLMTSGDMRRAGSAASSKGQQKAQAPPAAPPQASGQQKVQLPPAGAVPNPYKIGDAVEVWSNSIKDWFSGEVKSVQGNMVEVLFKGPDGAPLNKGVDANSAEIRLKGSHHSNAPPLPPRNNSAGETLARIPTKPKADRDDGQPGSPKGQARAPPAESTYDLAERAARPSLGRPVGPNAQGVFVDAFVDLAPSGPNYTAAKRTSRFSADALHGPNTQQVMNHVENQPEIVRPHKFDTNPQASRVANQIVSQAVQMTQAVGQETFDLQDKAWQGPMGRDPLTQLMGETNLEVIAQGLETLAQEVQNILKTQPMLVEAEAPVKIFGDIHGQFRDMLVFFSRFGFPQAGGPMFIFNGDWLDRGAHQLEVVAVVLALKAVFPMRVWLIRGNHEDTHQNQAMGPCGFHNHCMQRLGQQIGYRVFNTIHVALCYLPFACLVNKRILVVHGGIGDGRWTLDHIRNQRPPIDHDGLVRDPVLFNVLWSDPIPDNPSMELDTCGVHASPRDGHQNLIVTFAKDVTDLFCARNGIALVVRSHQAIAQGHGYDIMHGGRCMRVFSARDYEGAGNDSAILSIYEAVQAKSQVPALFLRSQVLGSVMTPKPYA